ncbi:MAG TPA: T9SS type A sorting domain-containing protein [Chitinophagaceae bacterium]|nr:T9SS type A sorting domain-containing protein [Chitinophagaceae bacterium]
MLIDGNFSTTTSIMPYYTDPPPLYMWLSWANYYGTGASFTTSIQNGVCSYFIDNPGTNMFDVQMTQYGFPLSLNLECLKNAFDNANNNLTFVQPHPCSVATTRADNNAVQELSAAGVKAKIWPNPSNNYFTLRPGNEGSNETVQLKVYDATGKQVYTAHGISSKDYRFGEGFSQGVYMVELIQLNNRSTFKLVKQ